METKVSVMRWWAGQVGVSVKEVTSQHVKFPTISICLDQDEKKEVLGFQGCDSI